MRYVLLSLIVASHNLGAQRFYPPERSGLIASIAAGRAALSLGSGAFQTRRMLSTRAGLRFNPLWRTSNNSVRMMLHAAVAVTDIAGMDPKKDPYALSDVEGGLEGSVRLHPHLRPYVFYRLGTHTAEHFDNEQVFNYSGSGNSKGLGFEIPILAGGSGLDLGFRIGSGRFNKAERLAQKHDIDVSYRERIWYVGWSGSLRGMASRPK